jgi:cytochrome c-type biogenesis protein CcmH/NrfG
MSAKAVKSATTGVGPLVVALLMGTAALVMLLTSVNYRLENPSMTMTMRSNQGRAGMESGAMDRVGELMVQVRENPEDVPALLELGRLFFRMESYDNARAFLGRAVKLAPENGEALRLYGMTLFHAGDREGAAQAFAAMVELDPDNAAARYNLGVLQKHFLNKTEAARGQFQAVLETPEASEELKQKAREELESPHGGD